MAVDRQQRRNELSYSRGFRGKGGGIKGAAQAERESKSKEGDYRSYGEERYRKESAQAQRMNLRNGSQLARVKQYWADHDMPITPKGLKRMAEVLERAASRGYPMDWSQFYGEDEEGDPYGFLDLDDETDFWDAFRESYGKGEAA